MISQNALNQLSRRQWLRDTAIAATGAALLPSVLTGCTDHRIPPTVGVGIGGPANPLTPAEFDLYGQAAENLIRMRLWYTNLYTEFSQPYIFRVYALLKGGQEAPPSNWKDILVDIFTEIAIAILQAALAEFPGAGPAVAIAIKETEKWGINKKGGAGIDATIAEFVGGYDDLHTAVSLRLLALASSDNNYQSLREAFQGGDIDFNGKKYTLRDLAQQRFPSSTEPADTNQYKALLSAADLNFRKYIWYAMIVKAGSLVNTDKFGVNINFDDNGRLTPTELAQDYLYKKEEPARYLRGYREEITHYYGWWAFEFDGRRLSIDAARILFKDDTPGNIINPDGLFNRDYVFKQFHKEKPDFKLYYGLSRGYTTYDLRTDRGYGPGEDDARGFDPNPDFEFTGRLPK